MSFFWGSETWEADPQPGDVVHVGFFGKEEIVTGRTTGGRFSPDTEGDWPYVLTKDMED